MRHEAATVHELSRVAELAVLPGETLRKLAREMERHELGPGQELDAAGRFAVVLGGMLTGGSGVLRPGDRLAGSARALTPAAVATCDEAVYEEIATGSG
ncbi:MAG: hypothetical protein ACRDNI_08590 [Gaiellaceae bacterium]